MYNISEPFFTAPTISVDGLSDNYARNENVAFTVKVQRYGSNCYMLQVESIHDGDRKFFYRKADDCRYT